MLKYFDELRDAMTYLSSFPNTIFWGQAVKYPGTSMFNTLVNVPEYKKFEFPVAENLQMGCTLGASLNGLIPISIFPRLDFLIEASSQLVSHVDKLPKYSSYRPHLIIRTAVGSKEPLDPSEQHKNDYTSAFRHLLSTVNVVKLQDPSDIFPAYAHAITEPRCHLLIEVADYYNSK